MAAGSIVLDLLMRTGSFETDTKRAEKRLREFQKQAEALGKAIGVGLTAAATIAVVAFDRLANGAAQFKDLEETTGASAESLASLAVSAATAGVSMENVGGSINKLTKNLVGVDDESKAAGAALAALGINVKEFKTLDPASQYEAVGRALSGFADGAGKTAVAMALFGKSGAEQLKVFKALEEAGGRQTILTQAQIESADKYADAQARAGAQLKLYAQAAASEALPAIAGLTSVVADFAKELIGVDAASGQLAANNGARTFAEGVSNAFAFAADQVLLVSRLFEVSGKFIAAYAAAASSMMRGNFAEAKAIGAAFRADLDDIDKRLTFTQRLANQRAGGGSGKRADAFSDPRSLVFGQAKPSLSFAGATTGGSKAAAERVSDAERYLKSLEQQLQKTQDLSAAETVLADIQSGRLKLSGGVTEAQLLGVAVQIDAVKAFEQAQKEAADKTQDFLKSMEDQRKASEALKKSDDDRLASLLSNTPSEVFRRQQDDIEFLRQNLDAATISAQQYGEAVGSVMGHSREVTKEANDAARELGMTFSSAFEDAIVGGKKFRDVLESLGQDISRILARKLFTEPLAAGITGAIGSGSSGGGWGSIFDAFMKGWGGGKAGGGYTSGNTLYQVAERGPEVYDDGQNKYLLTGPGNGRIDPNPRFAGGSRTINAPITINVAGSMDRRTADQTAAKAAREVARANSRFN